MFPFGLFSAKSYTGTVLNSAHSQCKQPDNIQDLPLNKTEGNLSASDVWMNLIAIWFLYNFNLYILSTPHMNTVTYIYNVFYYSLLFIEFQLYISAPWRWL